MIWNYFFPTPKPAKNNTEVAEKSNESGSETKKTNPTTSDASPSNPTPQTQPLVQNNVNSAEIKPAEVFKERTDRLSVVGEKVFVSNRGGRVVSVLITEPDRFKNAGDLLGQFPKKSEYFPFQIKIDNGIIAIPNNYIYQVVETESEKTDNGYRKIVYRFNDPANRYVIDKIYQAKENSPYQYTLHVKITNLMATAPLKETVSLNIYGYDDPNVDRSFLETRADRVEAVCKTEDGLERKPVDKIEKPETFDYPTLWAAIDKRYFVFAAIPNNLGTQCTMGKIDKEFLQTQMSQKTLDLKPGESATVSWLLFTGPKDFDILTDVGHEIRETVDFGMLSFIARPLRWILVKIQGVVVNWGLAIIVLTIIIRLLLWPLNHLAYSQTEKMRRVQPQINEIKEKYKGDPQKIQEEQFKLMKETGTTPFGCLPMFLQFPILLALYFMILNSVELYHANFIFWYDNLAVKDPYFVLPILMGITMFLQQHFMTPEMDPNNPAASMQNIMKFMPVLFTAFMLFLPSGVVLYYFVSLIIGLGQQYLIRNSLAKKYAEIDAEAERVLASQSKNPK